MFTYLPKKKTKQPLAVFFLHYFFILKEILIISFPNLTRQIIQIQLITNKIQTTMNKNRKKKKKVKIQTSLKVSKVVFQHKDTYFLYAGSFCSSFSLTFSHRRTVIHVMLLMFNTYTNINTLEKYGEKNKHYMKTDCLDLVPNNQKEVKKGLNN